MRSRLTNCLTAVAVAMSGVFAIGVTSPAVATTTPVHALVGIGRTALLNTATGIGAPRRRLAPHQWTTFTVPAGPLTAAGHTIVLTVNTSASTAKGAIGLVSARTTSAPAMVLNYSAAKPTGTTVLRPASSGRTLSLYNNSAGYVNVAVTAVGYVQPSPTETFHTASYTMLNTSIGIGSAARPLARGTWLTPRAVGGSIPASATSVVTQVAATGGSAGGSVSVLNARPATAPTSGQLGYPPHAVAVGAFIDPLAANKSLYAYNTGSAPVTLVARVIGYVTPVPTVPATVVTGLTATSPSKGVVNLTWVNPPGTINVVVRRSSSTTPPATPTSDSPIQLTSASSGTDSTPNLFLGPATYTVFVQSASGVSSASIGRPGPQPPTPTPPAWGYPIGSGCNPSPGEMLYTWDQTGSVDHYIVGLSPKGGGVMFSPGGGTPTGTTLPGTARSFKATGLEDRGEYGFTIYAFDAVGNFSTDTYIDCIAQGSDQVPTPVTGVTGTATPSSVTLNWSNESPPAAYNVTVAISRAEGSVGPTSPNGPTVIASMSAPGSSTITDPTVVAGHTYTYTVWTVNGSGVYGTPVSYTISVPPGAPPSPVTGLTASALPQSPTNTGESIHLAWTAPGTAPAGYVIARAVGTAANPRPASPSTVYAGGAYRVDASTTAFTDASLPKNTYIAYSVWAVAADGTYSPVATTSATTDPGLPRTVSGRITNSATHSQITQATTITWITGPYDHLTTVSAVVDATGAYSVQLPVAVYQACIDYKSLSAGATYGYFRTCTQETVGATASSIDLSVNPKGAVTGTVTDSHGQPIAGATVSMPDPVAMQIGPYPPQVSTTTDARGEYTLTGATAGSRPAVAVGGPGLNGTNAYAQASPATTAAVPAGGSVVQDFILTALPTITISGTVINAVTAAPAPGVKLYFLRGSGNGYSTATTAPDGSYSQTFAVNSGDSFQVCAGAEAADLGLTNQCFGGADYDAPSAQYFSGAVYGSATAISSTQTANIALQPESTVTGQVLGQGGVGIAGVKVTAWMTNRADRERILATTDPSGTYVIHTPLAADMTNLQPRLCAHVGTITDAASPAGYIDAPVCSAAVDVSPTLPSGSSSSLSIPFAAGLTGLITANGKPAGGVTVTVSDTNYNSNTYPQYSAVTDASGRYTIADMDPGGSKLIVSTGPYTSPTAGPFLGTPYPGPTPSSLALDAGTLTDADIALVPAATISGTVTAADTGHPLAGVVVHGDSQTAVTDAAGRYTFNDLPDGYTTVFADAVTSGPGPGYQATQTSGTATPGATAAFDLTMPIAAEVDVRVVAPDGTPLEGMLPALTSVHGPSGFAPTNSFGLTQGRAMSPAAGGVVCVSGTSGAPNQLSLFTAGCTAIGPYAAGHVTTVTVVAGYGGAVKASVYDSTTGEPITGASVTFTAVSPTTAGATTTTFDGVAVSNPATDMSLPPSSGNSPTPMTTARFRVCAQAPGYAPACAADDSADGTSGSIFASYQDMITFASIGLTPN